MKRWKIGALVCAVVACACLVLTGCQAQSYSPAAKEPTVSASALGQAGTLRVGVNAASAPLAGQTASSARIVGIDVDVAAYLADQLGCKVEIVDVGTEPEKALENKTVDIVLGVDASDTDAKYWKSETYLDTSVALFGTSAESAVPTTDSKPKIAAQASSKSSWRVTNLFGEDSLVVQSDLKSAFDALSSGSARYVAADAVIGTYVAFSNGDNDKIVALLQDPTGYCAAVASSNTELQAAITSAMSKLVGGGVMSIIEEKWLGTTLNVDAITVIKAPTAEASASAAAAPAEGEAAAEGEAPAEGEAAAAEAPAEGEAPAAEAPAEG